jgi:hypothetical protein
MQRGWCGVGAARRTKKGWILYIRAGERGGVLAVAARGEYTGTARVLDGVVGGGGATVGAVGEAAGGGVELRGGEGDGESVGDGSGEGVLAREDGADIALDTEIGLEAVPRAKRARPARMPSSAPSSASAMVGEETSERDVVLGKYWCCAWVTGLWVASGG